MNPRALICGAGAVCFWSTNAVVAKYALAGLPVAQVQTLQFAGASAAFLILRGLFSRSERALPKPDALLLGLVGLVGTMVFQYLAFSIGPIALVNLLAYAWPLLTVVILGMTGGAARPLGLIVASAAGFGGVMLLVGGAEPDLEHGDTIAGYAAAVASALCMAVYSIGVARISSPPASTLLPASVIGLAGTGMWWATTGAALADFEYVLVCLYLGAGPMGLGYVLWAYAMRFGAVGPLSMLGYATPVLSTALLILSGERLTAMAFMGGVVVVVSCAAIGVLRREDPAHAASR